jgi:formylglycine-generating enzyme
VLRNVLGEPTGFAADLFVSFGSHGRSQAIRIIDALRAEGYDVDYDDDDIVTDTRIGRRLQARALLVVRGAPALSRTTALDALDFKERARPIIELRLDWMTTAQPLAAAARCDLIDWRGDPDDQAWQNLRAAIRRLIGAPRPSARPKPLPPVDDAEVSPAPGPTAEAMPDPPQAPTDAATTAAIRDARPGAGHPSAQRKPLISLGPLPARLRAARARLAELLRGTPMGMGVAVAAGGAAGLALGQQALTAPAAAYALAAMVPLFVAVHGRWMSRQVADAGLVLEDPPAATPDLPPPQWLRASARPRTDALFDMVRVPGGRVRLGPYPAPKRAPTATAARVPGAERGGTQAETGVTQELVLRPFLLQRAPLTRAEVRRLLDRPGPPQWQAQDGDALPATHLSWTDALALCNALSVRARLRPAYRRLAGFRIWDRRANGYRLPTEAEWEAACRALRGSRYPWEQGEPQAHAWFDDNAGGTLRPVGALKENPLGLADMAGLVWEWCWAGQGVGMPGLGHLVLALPGPKALRGGGFLADARQLDCGQRGAHGPELRSALVGVRLVRSLLDRPTPSSSASTSGACRRPMGPGSGPDTAVQDSAGEGAAMRRHMGQLSVSRTKPRCEPHR